MAHANDTQHVSVLVKLRENAWVLYLLHLQQQCVYHMNNLQPGVCISEPTATKLP